ncbi:hypothetical protein P692DRAFT_201684725, partial [Suillus brevipes Sb2]
PDFSVNEMHRHIVRFIIADDQSDIPHCTKFRSLIIDAWRDYFPILKRDLALRPFLALTAHWLARETANSSLVLKGTLIAFHYMPGSHVGKALGSTIFNLIKCAGVTHNVSVYLRSIVRAACASNKQRDNFRDIICVGNDVKIFRNSNFEEIMLPILELLCNEPTLEWQILQDLEVVLEAPYAVQQSMSSESTPVLSCAIPAFERLVKKWKDLAQRFAHLAPFVAIGLTWTDKYHERMSHTGAYGVAMFIDPAIRLSWMNDNWDMVRVNKARDYILELKRVRDTSDSALSLPLERSDHQTRTATLGSTIYGLSDIDLLPHNEGGTQTVEQEFSSYSTAVRSPRGTNLLAFWTVRTAQPIFPTIYSIAMDYLPI